MTIQEIYNWAKENNCLDIDVAKHINMNFYDIETILLLSSEIPEYNLDYDRVVLD